MLCYNKTRRTCFGNASRCRKAAFVLPNFLDVIILASCCLSSDSNSFAMKSPVGKRMSQANKESTAVVEVTKALHMGFYLFHFIVLDKLHVVGACRLLNTCRTNCRSRSFSMEANSIFHPKAPNTNNLHACDCKVDHRQICWHHRLFAEHLHPKCPFAAFGAVFTQRLGQE